MKSAEFLQSIIKKTARNQLTLNRTPLNLMGTAEDLPMMTMLSHLAETSLRLFEMTTLQT